jgi:tetratricopeptide (TPR) repeat protein
MDIPLASLIDLNQKWCFLAGAGISIDPPSGLPSGQQYIKMILSRIVPEELRESVVNLMEPNRAEEVLSGNFLRFEQLMEFLRQFDPGLSILEGFNAYIEPNFNHYFLAYMLVQQHSVFTTNFDSLIEYALLRIGQSKGSVAPIIVQEDLKSLADSHKIRVHKLHGSVTNVISGENTRPSLQASVSQIAGDKGELFTLETWKIEIFTEHLQSRDLIVMGYSGLDELDVIPSLLKIPSTKRLFWIIHDGDRKVEDAIIRQLSLESSSSFTKSSEGNRTLRNLLLFQEKQTRALDNIYLIYVNTREFLKWLWTRYIDAPFTSDHAENPIDQFQISPFTLNLTEVQKWWVAANIFYNRNEKDRALQLYNRALEMATAAGDQDYIAGCLNDIGAILKSEHKFDESLNYYQKALLQNEQARNISNRHQIVNNIGAIYLAQGKYDKALEQFQTALKIAEMLGLASYKAKYLSNIGMVHKKKGEIEKAIKKYEEALHIIDLLGDIPQKGLLLNNIATIYHEKGDTDRAIALYRQALEIDEVLGDLAGKQQRIENLGALYFFKGDWLNALHYFEQGIHLNEKYGNSLKVAFYLANAGMALSQIDRIQDAEAYLNRSLALYQQADYPNGIASVYYNLGIINAMGGNLEKAWEFLEEAKSLAASHQMAQLLSQIEIYLEELSILMNKQQ